MKNTEHLEDNVVREMRKILTLTHSGDRRYKIVSASGFIYADEIDMSQLDVERHAIVCDFAEPLQIEGKIAECFYDKDTGKISVEYRDVTFSDYPLSLQVIKLKKDNEDLKSDNLALGQYVTDLELMILGGDSNV